MFLNNFIIGVLEDNTEIFTLSFLIKGFVGCTKFLGYPTGRCINLFVNHQPLTRFLILPLIRTFNPVFGYNLIILGSFALNFVFALRFYKKLFNPLISIILSLVLILSPYFFYQSRSHVELIQIWPVIWFFYIIFFSENRYKYLYLGLLLTAIMGISNYLGFFTIILTLLFAIFSLVLSKSRVLLFKEYFSKIMMSFLVFFSLSSTFLYPYIKSNYLSKKTDDTKVAGTVVLKRPLEDFIIFSSRPWFYLIPSVDNPFFGSISELFLVKLSSGGNYLTKNYFKSEHSASYLGWSNLVVASFGVFSIFRRYRVSSKESTGVSKKNAVVLLSCIIGLVLLSMPPQVSLFGVNLYLPSYFLYVAFPMFRVLTRLGVFILFLVLIFTGYGYKEILNLGSSYRNKTVICYLLTIFFFIFSILEFFIPVKLTDVSQVPKVYQYLGSVTDSNNPVVVYPYNKTFGAAYWIDRYNKPLVNPRAQDDIKTGFISEEFTENLNTLVGIDKAKERGAKYLVYFYEVDAGANIDFFENVPNLTKVYQFVEDEQDERKLFFPYSSKFVFARIVNEGAGKSNSAILYSLN